MDAQDLGPEQKDEKFKKGDYSVHVYIEESKGLVPVENEVSDPTIRVRCFAKSKCTKMLKTVGTNSTSLWNEHLYFSKLGCSIPEIENEKIIIEVLDSGLANGSSLIGSYEMDMTYVYFQPKHCILHQWVVLTNPYSTNISVMRGILKIGVNVLHESDRPEDLTQKTTSDSLSVPPQVKLRTVQLVIQLLKAESLPIMDTIGTVDAYCLARFGNAEYESSIIKADRTNLSVYWYEEILLPVIIPCIAHKVTIMIYDHDYIPGYDELVGALTFKWEDIRDDEDTQFEWYNIYGAPPNFSDKVAAEHMNLIDQEASHWRGRMLMRMFRREDSNPCMKKNKIETKEMKTLVHHKLEKEEDYQIVAQVFEGVNLPRDGEDYSIIIQFGNLKLSSKVLTSQSNCCKWFETLKRSVVGIPEDASLPDTFVYLMSGEDPICFARLKTEEFMDPDMKERWFNLTPNKAVGKVVNSWEGGHILLRLCVDLESRQELKAEQWKKKIEVPQNIIKMNLVCGLYQCRNLPSADADGLADPYVKIICSSVSDSTDKKEKQGILNPMWYRQFIIPVSFSSPETAPPVIVQVWDYDLGIQNDDMMGFCEINMQRMQINPDPFPRPNWYPLSLGTKDTEEGEILISFALFNDYIPQFFLPPAIDVNVEVYALGLRDLKPALGWLPVNKAFLKIDLRDICYPGETQVLSELTTQPGSSGSSPNIGAVLSFRCKIPIDIWFCPSLNCKVHDYLMSGISQPLLGSFTINLIEAYSKTIGQETTEKSLTRRLTNLSMSHLNEPLENPGISRLLQPKKAFTFSASEISVPEVHSQSLRLNQSLNLLSKSSNRVSDSDMRTGSLRLNLTKEVPNLSLSSETEERKDNVRRIPPKKGSNLSISKFPEPEERTENVRRIPAKKLLNLSLSNPPDSEEQSESVRLIPAKKITNTSLSIISEPEEQNESSRLIKTSKSATAKKPQTDRGSLRSVTDLRQDILFGELLGISEAQKEGSIVVMPQFKPSETRKRKLLEVKLKNNQFVPLGYNRDPADEMKHYRYAIATSLEESTLSGKPPFQVFQIKKGQSRGLNKGFSLFSRSIEEPTVTNCGIFKGLVRVTYPEKEHAEDSKDDDGFEQIAKLLVTKSDCMIRIYILDGRDIMQKDSDSESDPYLILKLGDKKITDRENYISNASNPRFYRFFQMNCSFPGESTLKIQLWDHDDILPDDKIGTTKIDLEDRFFSETWKSLPEKPIETRALYIKSCSQPQGFLRLWVEIHPVYSKAKIWDITPRPPEKFELRLVIWSSEEVPNSDIEGVSDLYVVASMNSGEARETDTHYRAQEGKASWNWRMKFQLELTEESKCIIDLQLWDRDFLSSNDAIGGASLDLTEQAMQALELGEIVKKLGNSNKFSERIMRRENERFLVECFNKAGDGSEKKAGKLLISAEIVPEAKAIALQNGEGRSEPNIEPFLPDPEGRIKLSMNPFAMLSQMIGNELKRKIICAICCAACLFLFAMTFPMFFSNTLSIFLFS